MNLRVALRALRREGALVPRLSPGVGDHASGVRLAVTRERNLAVIVPRNVVGAPRLALEA